MKIQIIAVGMRMPEWNIAAVAEYQKRFPKNFPVKIIEVPAAKRNTNSLPQDLITTEGKTILNLISKQDLNVALHIPGEAWSTEQLAKNISSWDANFNVVNFIIGGADGLSQECLDKCQLKWSLSKLTFPHPLVRLVLIEQIYRAWSITINHPYHRA